MASRMVPVRFLLISDTHTARLAPPDSPYAFRQPMPKVDVLLHCGDLTEEGSLDDYDSTFKMLTQIDAELKLVIAGNHDLSLDPDYHDDDHWRKPADEMELKQHAQSMWKGDHAKAAGVTYLDEGFHEFKLKSGARFTVYASPYTPEFMGWAFPYERHEDRFNPSGGQPDPEIKCISKSPIPDYPNVDIIMTHGPPEGHLGMTSRGVDAGCHNLLHALRRSRPLLHCFGHIHEAWGAELIEWSDDLQSQESVKWSMTSRTPHADGFDRPEYLDIRETSSMHLQRGKRTLLVNAAIMNLRYKPANPPWVVDLDLPKLAPDATSL